MYKIEEEEIKKDLNRFVKILKQNGFRSENNRVVLHVSELEKFISFLEKDEFPIRYIVFKINEVSVQGEHLIIPFTIETTYFRDETVNGLPEVYEIYKDGNYQELLEKLKWLTIVVKLSLSAVNKFLEINSKLEKNTNAFLSSIALSVI